MENYGEIAGEQLFEHTAYDDLVADDFEFSVASAKMLGRQIKHIIQENTDLLARIKQILKLRLEGFSNDEIDVTNCVTQDEATSGTENTENGFITTSVILKK